MYGVYFPVTWTKNEIRQTRVELIVQRDVAVTQTTDKNQISRKKK